MSDLNGLTGAPLPPLPGDYEPLPIKRTVWQWSDPFRAILRFGGYTIDDLVDRPRAAAEVRLLWKVFKEAKRIRRAPPRPRGLED